MTRTQPKGWIFAGEPGRGEAFAGHGRASMESPGFHDGGLPGDRSPEIRLDTRGEEKGKGLYFRWALHTFSR